MQVRDTFRETPGSGRILIVMCCYYEVEVWRCAGTLPTTGKNDMESGTGSEI